MASYFIRKTGSDANAGTSAGAAWLTIGKALGASGIASGDSVYIGAGTYREVVTVAMTSATVTTSLIADTDGAQTGDVGEVIWTAYTTNDTTAPSTSTLLTLAGRDFLTFQGFTLVGGSNATNYVDASTTVSTNITFRDCTFSIGKPTGANGMNLTGLADTALNWTFDRCVFDGFGNANPQLLVTLPTSASADYDAVVLFQNCLLTGISVLVQITTSGAGAFKGGGVRVYNCTVQSFTGVVTSTANVSTTIPVLVYNSIFLCATALNANVSGQIVEDYNVLFAATPRTNVTAGANSIAYNGTSIARPMAFEWGQAEAGGRLRKLFYTPSIGSPFLGFGNQAGGPTVDFLNRPRPSGGASTNNGIGYIERHDIATKEISVTDAGGVGMKITGPGDQDVRIPVNASLTSLTVRVRYDTNHGTGNKPQAILLANGEIGVTTQTVTATVGVDTWETLTFTPFTPTAKGVVFVRLGSRAAAGSGIAYFDTMVAPDIDLGDFAYFQRGELVRDMSGPGSPPPRIMQVAGQTLPVY